MQLYKRLIVFLTLTTAASCAAPARTPEPGIEMEVITETVAGEASQTPYPTSTTLPPGTFTPTPTVSPAPTETPSPTATIEPDYTIERIAAFGIDDFENLGITSLGVFQDALYAGTRNGTTGGEVWKWDGQNWTRVLDHGLTEGGNGPMNTFIASLAVYNDRLYAGTFDFGLGWIFRTGDGEDWQIVRPYQYDFHPPGIYVEVSRMFEYQGWFYSVFNPDPRLNDIGFQLWRTKTGDYTDWFQVIRDGFDDPDHPLILAHEVYHDSLYVGTFTLSGTARIYTTTDGISWQFLNDFEIDGIRNRRVTALAAFEEHLYAAVVERGDWDKIIARVYRCKVCAGDDWEMVFDGPYTHPGTYYKPGLEAYDGFLYLVVGNVTIQNDVRSSLGLEIWRTPDGDLWERIGDEGINHWKNDFTYYDNAMVVFDGSLYIGYDNDLSGGGVWRITHR